MRVEVIGKVRYGKIAVGLCVLGFLPAFFVSAVTAWAAPDESQVMTDSTRRGMSARVESEVEVSENGECRINLNIADNPGLMGFKLILKYDPREVTVLSAKSGSVTSGGTFTDNIGLSQGEFVLLWNSISETAENGCIASIDVTPLADSFNIGLSYSAPDTFNEKWEDVRLVCGNIVYGKDDDAGGVSSDIDTISDDDEKESSVIQANDESAVSGERYSDVDEMMTEDEEYALDGFEQELLSIAVQNGADKAVSDFLEQQGESSVTAQNADEVRAVLYDMGLDESSGRYIDDETFAQAVNRLYLGASSDESNNQNNNEDENDISQSTKSVGVSPTVFILVAVVFVVACVTVLTARKKQKE